MRMVRWFVGGLIGCTGLSLGAALGSSEDNIINSSGPIRFGRAFAVVATIAADYKFNLYYRTLPTEREEAEKLWSAVHLRSAKKLLWLCTRNKGVFVKVGQHIGAMDYLLPQEYTQTMRILHNKAPSSPIEDVHKVINVDLKVQIDDVFDEFNEEPLGTASLAQVYKAKLKNGEDVAVKVQHFNVRAHSVVDIATMEFLVHCAAKMFPDFKLLWLAETVRKNLPAELDFIQEARNAEKAAEVMKRFTWLKIPKVYWNLSSERVLVMEYCDGGLVNDRDYILRHGINPREVAAKLGTIFSEMIFINGYLHSDPHPGNILVRNDSKGKLELCLLDHGLYATLTDHIRFNYSNLWLSLLNSDINGIKKYSNELGVGDLYYIFSAMITARSWEAISSREGIARRKVSESEKSEIRKRISDFAVQISHVIESIPRPMIMILKTNDLLRGVEFSLRIQKTMASFLAMSKFCVRAVYDDKLKNCATKWCTLKYSTIKQWTLFKIRLYEVYLWINHIVYSRFGIEYDYW